MPSAKAVARDRISARSAPRSASGSARASAAASAGSAAASRLESGDPGFELGNAPGEPNKVAAAIARCSPSGRGARRRIGGGGRGGSGGGRIIGAAMLGRSRRPCPERGPRGRRTCETLHHLGQRGIRRRRDDLLLPQVEETSRKGGGIFGVVHGRDPDERRGNGGGACSVGGSGAA